MRLSRRTGALATAILLLPLGGRAQEGDPDGLLLRAQPALEPALQAALEQAAPNRPVPWDDPATGLGGEIVAAPATFDGRPCRAVRWTVQDGARRVAAEGERCREPDGRWVGGRVADSVLAAPAASPLIRDLQAALHRLAYYDGAVDGVASATLATAILAFEHDERVPPDSEPTPGLLEMADAAIGRIPGPGTCDAGVPVPAGRSVACGSIR